MKEKRRISFQMKLLVLMLGIMLLFGVIYSVFYGITKHMLRKNMIAYSEVYVDYISSSITSMVEEVDRLSMTFLLQDEMIDKLGRELPKDSEEYMKHYRAVHDAIEQALNVRVDAEAILIADADGEVITDGPNVPYLEGTNIADEEWYRQFMESEAMFRFMPLHKTNVSEVFSIVRKLRSYEQMQVNGIIRIDMKKSLLDKICNKRQFSKNSVVLFDSSRELFYLSGEKLTEAEQAEIQKQLRTQPYSFQVVCDHNALNVSLTYSEYLDIYVAYIVPQDILMRDLRDLSRITIVLSVLGGSLGIILAVGASRVMARSVRTVMEGMHKIEGGNLDVEIKVDSNDEIRTIAGGLNHMVKKIKILMEEKAQMERKKKEAEMIMLQRQIRPHFLYNTLDGIRMKALLNQDHEAAGMIEKLSLLLRRATDTKTEYVTVQEEIDYVTYYIDLQNMRFRYKFQLMIQVEDQVKEMIIPKFCLQPLVENAIHHGLEKRKMNRQICISSEIQDGKVYLIVSDNGQGISEERLQEIRATLNNPDMLESEHVGLNNINVRLKLYYGQEYGLTIDSKERQGTVLRLCLPWKQEKGKDVPHV